MGERDGDAVVCSRCKGQGWQESVFTEFTGRKEKSGVRRVFQTNPGIGIGEVKEKGITLASFGGMPVADWIAGKPFTPGMENRTYTCPCWWAQCAGESKPKFKECGYGRFSDCKHFSNKAVCWSKWDKERAGK